MQAAASHQEPPTESTEQEHSGSRVVACRAVQQQRLWSPVKANTLTRLFEALVKSGERQGQVQTRMRQEGRRAARRGRNRCTHAGKDTKDGGGVGGCTASTSPGVAEQSGVLISRRYLTRYGMMWPDDQVLLVAGFHVTNSLAGGLMQLQSRLFHEALSAILS